MLGLTIAGLAAWPATTAGNGGVPPSVTTGIGAVDLAGGDGDLTLTGSVNPNGSGTTCLFEYGPDDPENRPGPYVHSVPCQESPGSGASNVEVRATIASADIPAGEADHFRLVATNAHGTTHGEDQPVATVVCFCGPGPRPVQSKAFAGAKAPIRDGFVQVRVSCRGGETGCGGEIRLVARKKRTARGPVKTAVLGEELYELSPDTTEIVPIAYPRWSRHLLRRRPGEVRFVLTGPELARQVVEFTKVDF